MSIANLSNPNAKQDIYCDTVTCSTLDASFTQVAAASVQNLVSENLQLLPLPPINNTFNSLLSVDNVGSVVIRESSTLGGGVTLPSQPDELARFTNTTGNIASSGLLTGNVADLVSPQKFTASKVFRDPVTFGDTTFSPTTTQGTINLALTTTATSTIRAGGGSSAPIQMVTTTGKVITVPEISNATDTVALLDETQTMKNKTFSTPVTIDITNAQGSPMTFYQGPYTGTTWFDLVFLDNGDRVNNVFAIGTNPRTDGPGPSITIWGYAARPMRFATSGVERFRIDAGGITLDTGATNMLCLNGTSMRYRDDIVTLSGGQVLSNKTISNLTSTGTVDSTLSAKVVRNYITGISTVGAVTSTFATVTVPLNTIMTIKVWINSICTVSAGGDLNKIRVFDATFACKNIAGVLTPYTVTSNNATDGAFNVVLSITSPGAAAQVQVTGIAGDTIVYSGVVKLIYQ